MNKLFFALKFKQLSSIIKAFGWFENDLQMLLICRLKFNLSSKGIPKSSTDETDLIVWLSIVNGMFVRLDFFLSRIMAWNLSGLIIISFFVNQSMAILLSDSNVPINLESVSPQAHRVLSSAKLCIEAISMKKNKSLMERLNKIGPSIEPCGTPEIISL